MSDRVGTGATPKVLLVDDRPDNLLALEAVLEPLDLDLVLAESGAEALGALLDDEFAVVVLDVQMPDLDGFETARLIKGRERTRLLPIIFLTAISHEPHHHIAGYKVGAVDYIKKPFDADILRAKVMVFAELWRRGQLIDAQRAALVGQVNDIERLNAQLERSNAVLDSFASRAAEDLLEPLDAIAWTVTPRSPTPTALALSNALRCSRTRSASVWLRCSTTPKPDRSPSTSSPSC